MKILIVDDNAEDRTILRFYLNQSGDQVLEAGDGAEGLALAHAERPDLIISDALMPNVDGFEFLREINRSSDLWNIPFIFYSAVYTGCRDEELAMSLGADAFLVKPLEPEEFMLQLRNVMAGLDKSKKRAVCELLDEDEQYLRKYSHMVAARLEEKVCELNQANRKLAKSEARYRNLFNSIRDLIIIADNSRTIIDANQPALKEMLGYETSEVVGRRTDFLYGSIEAFALTGKEIFDKKEPQKGLTLEVPLRKKSGDLFVSELFGLKMLDDYGNPIGNIGIFRDITDRKKMEEQLRHSQKMESVGILAGGIAHDFNNILTAIIGYGEITLMKMANDEPLRHNVEAMLEGTDRAARLTKQLLLFSRKKPADKKQVDLNDVVARVGKFLIKIIGEDIVYKSALHPAGLPVLADEHQLEQAIINLATNARDAMPLGGVFTTEIGIVTMNKEFITAHGYGKPGTYALISVTDTGIGMDKETQERIFEPFFTTKEVGKGTGLGLAVTYGIIKQHDGYINLYSEPGVGTTFRIYLPVISPEAGEVCQAEQKEAPVGGSETILLAEDDEMVRRLEGSVLTEYGYTVIEAVDGAEAVSRFLEKSGAVDLLLLDLIMPKMNGKEVFDEIRKISPGIKAIFSSGYAPETISHKLLLAEGAHQMAKPVTPIELLKKVRSVLDEGKS